MIGPIVNARDRDLLQDTGNLPNMQDAMASWFQALVFKVITKSIVNFIEVETETLCNCQGVMQPLSEQQLGMKPEGQRDWKWYNLHADVSLILSPDDVVVYKGERFRVMGKKDYKEYGYVQYNLGQDYRKRP